VRVLAAIDKFRGTLTARDAARAVGDACFESGHDAVELPLADGGEGTLEALGGGNRVTEVTGPLGDPVRATWQLRRNTAIIEMATASGLALLGGPEHNNALAATTTGTGELIDAALDAGARRIIVGLGGSATTDGGLGAIGAIHAPGRLRRVELLVACDVDTSFVDAARVFAPQKGATPAQVQLLTRRLEQLVQRYRSLYGLDVSTLPGAGAAGGLAGGLAALGGRLLPGFDLVADAVDLGEHLERADLVVTGEGHLDDQSFHGKVVGGVVRLAAEVGVPVAVVCGSIDPNLDPSLVDGLTVVSLVELFGEERSLSQPRWCVEAAVREMLGSISR
jgi:glycerate kinase